MKYFLSITFLFLTSTGLGVLSCSPLMEEGGFVDVQAVISSEVGARPPAASTPDEDDDSSQDTDVPKPVGSEDVEAVPEKGEPPPTRIFTR